MLALFLDAGITIEAESKGQARRIFIQRGGEILRIVEIEDSQEGLARDGVVSSPIRFTA